MKNLFLIGFVVLVSFSAFAEGVKEQEKYRIPISAASDSDLHPAVSGVHNLKGGSTVGILGVSNSHNGGVGVKGKVADYGNGASTGVLGESGGMYGQGVVGRNLSATGNAVGVMGESRSSRGIAVKGITNTKIGISYGVIGEVMSPRSVGILGKNNASQGQATGVMGITASQNGIAVRGISLHQYSWNYGVVGESFSPNGYGLLGRNYGKKGKAIGIIGVSDSATEGIGIRGVGGRHGILGETYLEGSIAIAGKNYATEETSIGVQGTSKSNCGIGVEGVIDNENTEDAIGVKGRVRSANSYAVYGINNAKSGFAVGVYASTESPEGYPGYFVGGQGIKIPVLNNDPPNPQDGTIWMNRDEGKMKIRLLGRNFSLKME